MAERIIIDPAEEIAGRTEFDITDWMTPEGVEWPATTNAPFYADGEVGQIVIDERWNNREVPIPLRLQDRGGTAFATARSVFNAKVGELQGGRGGVLKRVTTDGTVYADIVSARLRLSGDWAQAYADYDVNASLELVLGPENYGEWVELDEMTGTGEIVGVLREGGSTAVIRGNFPRGNRCRIVIRDTSGNDQRGLYCAFRSRHYDAAATAALSFEAEALTPLDTARTARLTGAFGGTAVQHASLAARWTPVLSTDLAGAELTHAGAYRVVARVQSPDNSDICVRLVWSAGAVALPSENKPATLPGPVGGASIGHVMADLGVIRLPSGATWTGQIQAKGASGGESIYVDKIWFVPIDEFMVRASAVLVPSEGLAPYTARDAFNGSGALTGQSLDVGGRWTAAGDTDDGTVTNGVLRRTSRADTDNRYWFAGTSRPTAVAVGVTLRTSAAGASGGVLARWVDATHTLQVGVQHALGDIGTLQLYVSLTNGGSEFLRYGDQQPTFRYAPDVDYRMIFMVTAAGEWALWFGLADSVPQFCGAGRHAALAAGGALDDGLVGFFDYYNSSATVNRDYDDFAVWVPQLDAVIFADQAAQLATDGLGRQGATGGLYTPMSNALGNLPRLPNGHGVELFVKPSRGDFDQLSDDFLDDCSARVFYRPCWLGVAG